MGRVPDSAQGPTGWFSTLAFYIRVVFNAANLQNYASSLEEKLWEASNANWTLQISTLNNYQESVFELFARIPPFRYHNPPSERFLFHLAGCMIFYSSFASNGSTLHFFIQLVDVDWYSFGIFYIVDAFKRNIQIYYKIMIYRILRRKIYYKTKK